MINYITRLYFKIQLIKLSSCISFKIEFSPNLELNGPFVRIDFLIIFKKKKKGESLLNFNYKVNHLSLRQNKNKYFNSNTR